MSLSNFKKAALVVLLVFLLIAFSAGMFIFYFQDGISPLMTAKAFWSGYSLAYQGDYQDKVGRTVMAKKSRHTPELFDDFGGGALSDSEPAWWEGGVGFLNPIYGVGIFKQWEEIQGEKDRHLVLTGPEGEVLIKLRTVFEARTELFGRFQTVLCVDNLNLDTGDFERLGEKPTFAPLAYLSGFSQEEIGKLLKPGDVVGFLLRYEGELTGFPPKGEPLKDDFETPVLSMLILRRFGGQEQLEKELGRKFEED